MNIMKEIRIEKMTLNFGAGVNQDLLKKGAVLLKNITGVEPVKTISYKRIPGWGVRPGLPLGCKITLRGKQVVPLLKRFLAAKENKIAKSCFDSNGNVAFGIPEYIDVPDLNYDASIGIIGFQVCVTLIRPGYRIKFRRNLNRKIGLHHKISQDDSIAYFKEKFNINIGE
jgi:large subunit ribosomal protein L5